MSPAVSRYFAASTDLPRRGAVRPKLGKGGVEPGEAVALLQRCLRRMGFYTGPISGVFDAPTDAAVRQQQALGLVVDGTVGDQTWGFLG
jgi:peptidoglycan hydrolase-like protein with peptidoglycan-binding domain